MKSDPIQSSIFKNFSFYGYHCRSPHAKHGVGTLTSNTILHKDITSNTTLNAIAVEIYAVMTFILVNVCIPPFTYPSISDLNNLVSNLNKPIIFIGDLNAWSPQWGSKPFNKKGHTVSKLILDNDLVLNNDQPTYFSTHNSFTNADIRLCSSRMYTFISW